MKPNSDFLNEKLDTKKHTVCPCCGNMIAFSLRNANQQNMLLNEFIMFCPNSKKGYRKIALGQRCNFQEADEVKIKSIWEQIKIQY